MIVMHPVVEVLTADGFDLWPVTEVECSGYRPLHGGLSDAEVGTAVMGIAAWNRGYPAGLPDAERPRMPIDPSGAFLHGLLIAGKDAYASGGLRVTDTSTGVVFLPACCDGLEDWRDWWQVTEAGQSLWYGHEPLSPHAEPLGDTVRLTVNADQDDSPVIELPLAELRRLLADAERHLVEFLALAADWATGHIPSHADRLTAALARLLHVPHPPS